MRAMTPEEKYINEVFGISDPELEPVSRALKEHGVDYMSINGHEARLLQFLVRFSGAKKVVEVGTLFGYSGLCLAKALPADGRLFTLEKSTEHWEVAQRIFTSAPDGRKVTSLCGDAAELLVQIEKDGPFDMIFIDADKYSYTKYLDWAEKHVRKGGLIVGDNTFLWGGVFDQVREGREAGEKSIVAMKEFNKRLSDTKRYNSTLIPTTEGMTVAQKLF
jgi:predicted O-methyltransferase YrrM